MTSKFSKLFGIPKLAVIGMIHTKPLPGTPKNRLSVDEIVRNATIEAETYREAAVDGVLIENMADLPYIQAKHFGPEVVATMTRIATEVRASLPPSIPCGIQILAGGSREALAVSKACNLQFIRSEAFVFSHVADEGWMDACAGDILRYRKFIEAEDVLIFADIKKKHSAHTVTSDVTIEDTAKAAEFFLADGVILTGSSTGKEASPKELKDVRKVTDMPLLIGSGVTVDNVELFSDANGLIIGSHFKETGRWEAKLSVDRIRALMEKVRQIRG